MAFEVVLGVIGALRNTPAESLHSKAKSVTEGSATKLVHSRCVQALAMTLNKTQRKAFGVYKALLGHFCLKFSQNW